LSRGLRGRCDCRPSAEAVATVSQDRLKLGFRLGETVWPIYLYDTNRANEDPTWVAGLKSEVTGLLTTEEGQYICWGKGRVLMPPHMEFLASPESDVFRLRREARAEAALRNEVMRLRKVGGQ
jgi:hypothetical protein